MLSSDVEEAKINQRQKSNPPWQKNDPDIAVPVME
jgi:hypothetical protein